ncbi:unnamed protein product [Prorocentrum cordatum]|uniref:Uncharacterized protein n=1 Tax=Prorocentrum cordatum TaxID=2364126 RepID=A0ABN9PG59_9DINO|nr:unnamed protein product [Polarella glacialis]
MEAERKAKVDAESELSLLEDMLQEAVRTAEAERNMAQQPQSMAEAVRKAKVEMESKLVEAERSAQHFEGMLHEAERKAEVERKLTTLENWEFADETTKSMVRQATLAGYGVAQLSELLNALLKEAAGF